MCGETSFEALTKSDKDGSSGGSRECWSQPAGGTLKLRVVWAGLLGEEVVKAKTS